MCLMAAARIAGTFLALVVGLICAYAFLIDRAFQSQGPRPVGPSDRMISVDGLHIRYRQRADSGKPEAVLLHGFASSLEFWNGLAPRLDCVSSVALDLPGFGGSDRPAISYSLANQARYLTAFMDSLGIGRAVLIGQSMGSSLALYTAAHYPRRVSALVLFAPSGLPGSLYYPGLHGRLVRPGLLGTLGRWTLRVPGIRSALRNSLAWQGLTLAPSYDSSFVTTVASVRQPALLIWSEGDPLVPMAYAQRYAALMPQARLLTLPRQAGHGGPLFEPDATARRICDFLRSPGAAASDSVRVAAKNEPAGAIE